MDMLDLAYTVFTVLQFQPVLKLSGLSNAIGTRLPSALLNLYPIMGVKVDL